MNDIDVPTADGSTVTMPAEFRCTWRADGSLRVRAGELAAPGTEADDGE